MEHLGDEIPHSTLVFTHQYTDAHLRLQRNLLESMFIGFCEPFSWGNIANLGFGEVMNHREHDASAKRL
jgi:hypothetical protein